MIDNSPKDISLDVAVVGIGCHFPGANDYRSFWRNIFAGTESIRKLSASELESAGVPEEVYSNSRYVPACSVLNDVEYFDPAFFELNRKEASIMDPQHRHFLEVCHEALESSGYAHKTNDFRIGVFAGCGYNHYLQNHILTRTDLIEELGWFYLRHTSNDKDFLATRVAYELRLTGPCINLQTACSTSLVATHYACSSLLAGECDMALAGGVTIELPYGQGYQRNDGDILSQDGHCKAFSADSSGTVFGSGAGVVVLKRLDEAVNDGDYIFAVVKGSAVNNDGRNKVGFFAPGVDGHAQVVKDALEVSSIEPDSIELIEAHGTGTYLGDPVEAKALTSALGGSGTRKNYCALGSVKSQIGHLDTAAGIASLIKAIGAVHHSKIPPTLYAEKRNPEIDFANSPFYLPMKTDEWQSSVRRAGISSLGVGGTNAHVIIENYEVPQRRKPQKPSAYLVRMSANDPLAFQRLKNTYVEFLQDTTSITEADFFYTLNAHRKVRSTQKCYLASNLSDFLSILQSSDVPGASTLIDGKTVFMFAGGGAQRYDFGQELRRLHPEYARAFAQCEQIIKQETGFDYTEEIGGSAIDSEDPLRALPFLFASQYSFARFLEALGIQADGYVGHSMGEYTAACLAGIFSLEDALKIVIKRASLFNKTQPGSMLSASIGYKEALSYCSPTVSIAANNAPNLVVFSGSRTDLEELAKDLTEREIHSDWIRINVAAHSHLLEPILDEFQEFIEKIYRRAPEKTLYSNVTGKRLTSEDAVSAVYWRRHLRETVQFQSCVESMFQDGVRRFVEVGPGKVLASLTRLFQTEHGSRHLSGVFSGEQDSYRQILHLIGQIAASGLEPDWNILFSPEQARICPVPTYPFAKERCWIEPGKKESGQETDAPSLWQPVFKLIPLDPSEQYSVEKKQVLLLGSVDEEIQKLLKVSGEIPLLTNETQVHREIPLTIIVQCETVRGSVSQKSERLYEDLCQMYLEHQDTFESAQQLVFLTKASFSVAGEISDPSQRTITAFASVLSTELGIPVASIDFDTPHKEMFRFLSTSSLESRPYIFRNGSFFIQDFLPVSVSSPAEDFFNQVPNGETCILTGAFGALGSKLAVLLAKERNAKLILLGRRVPTNPGSISDYPAQYQPLIAELDAIGTPYTCVRLDLDQRESVLNAFNQRKGILPASVSIFHVAGVLNDSLLFEKDRTLARRVLRTKIAGIEVLLETLAEKSIRNCVLFSSTSSFQGLAGQSDYACANAVLDAFSTELVRRGIPAVTIGWGPWSGSGMAERIVQGSEKIPVPHSAFSGVLSIENSFSSTVSFSLTPDQWIVSEHTIPGIGKVLPATGMFEYILDAVNIVFGSTEYSIADLFFLKPVIVNTPGQLEVCITTASDDPQISVRYNGAEVAVAAISPSPSSDRVVDISKFTNRIEKNATIHLDQKDRINFGSRWNCLTGYSLRQGELLAQLEMPAQDLHSNLRTHPAMLDVALFGILRHVANLPATVGIFAPVRWEQASIYQKFPSHITVVNRAVLAGSAPTAILFDVDIFSDEGKLVAEFRGLRLQDVTTLQLQQAASQNAVITRNSVDDRVVAKLIRDGVSVRTGMKLLGAALDTSLPYLVSSRVKPTNEILQGTTLQNDANSSNQFERLSAVEMILTKHPEIHAAIVLRKQPLEGESRVLAYVQYLGNGAVTNTAIRNYLLSENVPERDVPVLCIETEQSLLDRASDGDTDDLFDPFETESDYEPPQNEFERYVARSWSSLLGIEKISRFDSFIDIGGHSLLALRFIQKVKKERGVLLEPGTMIVQNVLQIAEILSANEVGQLHPAPTAPVNEGLRTKIARGFRLSFWE